MTREEYMEYAGNVYRATRGLAALTPADKLDYKPMEGVFSVAQLLKHCGECLGKMASMALHDNWPQMPEGEMLPPADNFPRVSTIQEAINELDKDWQLMSEELQTLTDDEFNTKMVEPPWMPMPVPFAAFMMQSMEHLCNHRMQLFLWLKMSGEKLNTIHLYGMQ